MSFFHIEDLNINNDILPLLNFTFSPEGKISLLHIIQDVPANPKLLEDKQKTLSAIIQNLDVLDAYNYHLGSLNDIKSFMTQMTEKTLQLETNIKKGRIKWLFSAKMRYQDRSKYVQLIQFFHRFRTNYLDKLEIKEIPNSFKDKLKNISQFLERFSLDKYEQDIVHDRFAAASVIQLTNILYTIDPGTLQVFWENFHLFEAYTSIAKAVAKNNWVFPITDDKLSIVDFYHPMIKSPVLNTIEMNPEKNVVVLTGPNMSGKSTLLKTVGLCVYLSRAGLCVPAKSCSLPFFESIMISIDSYDNLETGLSHFMVELKKLKMIMEEAISNKKAFTIFDEIFRGTNTEDASDIMNITLAGTSKLKNLFFIASTHLLKTEESVANIPAAQPYFIECKLDRGNPHFTYNLLKGWSQLRIGKILFEKEGLMKMLEN